MPVTKPYYRILQVDQAAEPEVITAAYKRLALKYHPDSNKSPDALRRMQELNEAYEVLNDPLKRERYNLLLAAQQSQSHARPLYGDQDAPSPRGAERDGADRAWSDQNTPRADRRLGRSFIFVYGVVLMLLFRLLLPRITSIWMVLFIFIAAAVIALPVVNKIDDWLSKLG
jgi:curved DNA-binding protein CbpA